jgi:hypothetical protein
MIREMEPDLSVTDTHLSFSTPIFAVH